MINHPETKSALLHIDHLMQLCCQRFCKGILLLLLSIFLVACGSSQDDLHQYMRKVKSRLPKAVEPIPDYEQPSVFKYPEQTKRRSPFKPIAGVREDDQRLAPDMDRPKQPLEAYPLDALRFVGILKAGNQFWALIQQPDGVIIRVKHGDYMGKNFGHIIRITDNAIHLEETVKVDGKWEKKPITLKLHS